MPIRALALLALLALASARPKPNWNGVTDDDRFSFIYDEEISDNFGGAALNTYRWDVNGLSNAETGCPKWTGPHYDGVFSTYYGGGELYKHYYLDGKGELHLKMAIEKEAFFLGREYFCEDNFTCNYDPSINCFATDSDGNPIVKENGKYALKDHKLCARHPVCIPDPKRVSKNKRLYQKYTGPHIVGRKGFKYGLIETRWKIGKTSAVSAVWMSEAPAKNRDPSAPLAQSWSELDIVEAMDTVKHRKFYVPNAHFFGAGHSFASARNPLAPKSDNSKSSWSLNYGKVAELEESWASTYHVVGAYWSENEIRFILDGEEVFRLKNTLLRQEMALSLSMAFNPGWAQTNPSDQEIGAFTRIDYVRRFIVVPKYSNLRDPPSSLPLNLKMKSFRS